MAIASAARYSRTAKIMHWTVGLLVLTIVPVGIVMDNISSGTVQTSLYQLHKSVGVLIFILMTIRIINRFSSGAPSSDPALKAWERAVSGTVHWVLYGLLILNPLLGVFALSAYGAPTPFFGLFQIPPLIAKNTALADRLFFFHTWIGWAIGVLFCLHIAGALQHYLVKRDGVMQRMLPKAMGGN